jgi:hypothetical protein
LGNCASELKLVKEVFGEISKDMGRMLEHGLAFRDVCCKRVDKRPVGRDQVHVAFRFSVEVPGMRRVGCFLMPLPDATVCASYLLAFNEEAVAQARGTEEPESTMKESMLLLGQILSTSVERVIKRRDSGVLHVKFDGCQGVRADVRPAFALGARDELIVGSAAAKIGSFGAFRPILMLPVMC